MLASDPCIRSIHQHDPNWVGIRGSCCVDGRVVVNVYGLRGLNRHQRIGGSEAFWERGGKEEAKRNTAEAALAWMLCARRIGINESGVRKPSGKEEAKGKASAATLNGMLDACLACLMNRKMGAHLDV